MRPPFMQLSMPMVPTGLHPLGYVLPDTLLN